VSLWLVPTDASTQLGICYRITELSTSNLVEAVPGGVHAGSITDSGLMTGIIYYTNKPYSMLFHSLASGFVDLGNWNGLPTRGLDINQSGQIAVQIGDERGALRYTPGVGFESIGSLGGIGSEAQHAAVEINEAGEIAGISSVFEDEYHAFFWTPAKGMQDLGTLGGTTSRGNGLNDLGSVAGSSRVEDGSFHGFLYRPEQGMKDLGPGLAGCINNRGVAVCTDGSGWPSLCYHDRRVRLQSPWGLGLYSIGDINEHNLFAGVFWAIYQDQRFHPFFASEARGLVELSTLIPPDSGWELALISGMNNKCHIVGEGTYQGRSPLFLLDPIIPTPSIHHSGTNIVLSWVQTIFPLQLEDSERLEPNSWHPVETSETNLLSLSIDRPARFFRLRLKPVSGAEPVRTARLVQPWPLGGWPILYGTNRFVAVAADGLAARVVVEGYAEDPAGHPLSLEWGEVAGEEFGVFATTFAGTNVLALGQHELQFRVWDGRQTSTNHLALEVVPPAYVVSRILEFMERSPHTRPDAATFMGQLRRALRKSEAGQYARARAILERAYESASPSSYQSRWTVSDDDMENGAILHLLQQMIFVLSASDDHP